MYNITVPKYENVETFPWNRFRRAPVVTISKDICFVIYKSGDHIEYQQTDAAL